MMYSISRSRNPNMVQSRERNSRRYLSRIVPNIFRSSAWLMVIKSNLAGSMYAPVRLLLLQHMNNSKKYSIVESKRGIQQTGN